jgi:glucose uptake protein GlcU
MPFGLCNAFATFQRLMDRVLSGLKWSSCLMYFDDIIVVGTSFADPLSNIGGVLAARLRGVGLTQTAVA